MPIFNLNNQKDRNEYAKSDAEKAAPSFKVSLNFEINISGEGTKKEIVKALQNVINSLESISTDDEDAILDGSVWEDATLLTEIKAI